MEASSQTDKRIQFERKMEELQKQLLQMGERVELAIAKAIQALKEQQVSLAEEVIREDDAIDQLEMEIEEGCLTVIATQQPMARDLRKVATLYKMIVDLERMADYATDIARLVRLIGTEPLIKPLIDIPRMAAITQQMVKEALDAYIQEDVELAVEMAARDDEVDKLHKQIFRELFTVMLENPRTITQATHLLFVSRYLERIADHATNIAEDLLYLVEGRVVRHQALTRER